MNANITVSTLPQQSPLRFDPFLVILILTVLAVISGLLAVFIDAAQHCCLSMRVKKGKFLYTLKHFPYMNSLSPLYIYSDPFLKILFVQHYTLMSKTLILLQ